MFTGLVQALGRVESVREGDSARRLEIASGAIAPSLGVGDSVAISGVCLTATDVSSERFHVDVAHETLRRSNLGDCIEGARVNLELPLRPDDRLGGHFVQGHVDEVGRVAFAGPQGGDHVLRVGHSYPASIYVVEKGSIAVDGVSLTVAACGPGFFEVMLIPHTLSVTTLGDRAAGDGVNLEYDILAKYVARISEAYRGGDRDAGTPRRVSPKDDRR